MVSRRDHTDVITVSQGKECLREQLTQESKWERVMTDEVAQCESSKTMREGIDPSTPDCSSVGSLLREAVLVFEEMDK
jgi:hypothetical protein